MSKNVEVRLRLPGINKVMRGEGAQRKVNELAYRMLAAAGPGHEVVVTPHRYVARAHVQQEDDVQARRDPNGIELLNAMGATRQQ